MDLALDDQDSNCGGWVYDLRPGHCHCEVDHRHRGMAVFITGVLLSGLAEYHKLTGEKRVADSIVRGVDFVIADAWNELEGRFHYTSCPASRCTTPTRIVWPVAYAVRLAKKPRHIHVLHRCWETFLAASQTPTPRPGFGKGVRRAASEHRPEPGRTQGVGRGRRLSRYSKKTRRPHDTTRSC